MTLLRRLVKEEEGQGLVEYALIIAVISLVILVAGNAVTGALQGVFSRISTALGGPVTP